MAKKAIKKSNLQVNSSVEKVMSERYQCLITKSKAIFSDKHNSWINEDIEEALKNNVNYNK